MRSIFYLVEKRLASQEGLSSRELIIHLVGWLVGCLVASFLGRLVGWLVT
jgi:hypothetical protein